MTKPKGHTATFIKRRDKKPEFVVVAGELINTMPGTYHNYMKSASDHVVVVTRSSNAVNLKNRIKKALKIEPENSLTESEGFDEAYNVKSLIYPVSMKAELVEMSGQACVDEQNASLDNVRSLIEKKLTVETNAVGIRG